jgi:hypothetical protein
MKKAIVCFFTPGEGGRKTLPTSTTYYATTKIENLYPNSWSIVIQFEKPLEIQEYTSSCKVTFLVDSAPFYILDEICELFIYEGSKKVGKIVF